MSPPPIPNPPMLESLRSAANALLAGAGDDAGSARLAALAVQAIEKLTENLAQLLGQLGVRALVDRSVALARTTYPWLAGTAVMTPTDSPWQSLRVAMEQQDPRAIREGFVVLLATFVALLERLIGEGLVRRLLHDVWPEVFPQFAKEPT